MILSIIDLFLFILFSLPITYLAIFAVASLFNFSLCKELYDLEKHRIAILIPAYKEDSVISDCVSSCLSQLYPEDFYEVVVIADNMSEVTLAKLRALPIKVVIVNNEDRTKAYALNQGMNDLSNFDIALVLDADNVLEPLFLKKINAAFNKEWEVVQAHRIPKNRNTNVAVLDGISEEINNAIFRKGHYNMGLSAALVGSGMAFRFDRFKSVMSNLRAVGGFDKELEFIYLSQKIRIHYLHDAYVFDEKIQKVQDFSNQRRRWLAAQFYYALKYLKMLRVWIVQGNINTIDKLYQMLLFPRILFLGFIPLVALTIISLDPALGIKWMLLYMVLVIALLISIPRKEFDIKLFKALISIPRLFYVYTKNLFRLKGVNKKFIHTKHG